jgi:hypothetical protein
MTDFADEIPKKSSSGIPWHKIIEAVDRAEAEKRDPWMVNTADFRARFGIGYTEFCAIVLDMPIEDRERYEKIQSTDVEAAILWVIERSMGPAFDDNE